MEEIENIVIKWSGKEYVISNLQQTTTVMQLKNLIYTETGVLPARQKLLGLKCSGRWRFYIVEVAEFATSKCRL